MFLSVINLKDKPALRATNDIIFADSPLPKIIISSKFFFIIKFINIINKKMKLIFNFNEKVLADYYINK